jgi:hypothetical protein
MWMSIYKYYFSLLYLSIVIARALARKDITQRLS